MNKNFKYFNFINVVLGKLRRHFLGYVTEHMYVPMDKKWVNHFDQARATKGYKGDYSGYYYSYQFKDKTQFCV